MAEFRWTQKIDEGCAICSSPDNQRGYVDAISEAVARDSSGGVVGVVDIKLCAHCIEQMANLVGCMTPQETDDIVFRLHEAETAAEKAKDETASWIQRYHNLIDKLSEETKSDNSIALPSGS